MGATEKTDYVAATRAAVVIVERTDGRLLVVWNRRYEGWSLPGGKVEDGETSEQGAKRELLEETGLVAKSLRLIYGGPHAGLVPKVDDGTKRGTHVYVFRAGALEPGVPSEREPGCPITWLTREEFLKWSPMAAFYLPVFATLPFEPLPFQPGPIEDSDRFAAQRDLFFKQASLLLPYALGRLVTSRGKGEPQLVGIGVSLGAQARTMKCLTCGKEVETLETTESMHLGFNGWVLAPAGWFVKPAIKPWSGDDPDALIEDGGYCSTECITTADKMERCRDTYRDWQSRREMYEPELTFDPTTTTVADSQKQRLDAIVAWRKTYDAAMEERMVAAFGLGWRTLLSPKKDPP